VIALPGAWAHVMRRQCAPPPALLPVRHRRSSFSSPPHSSFIVVEDGSEEELTEMTPSAGARTGPRRSMDGDRAAAVELAQPARAQRRMERPLEFNLFRSTPIVLYTMQNEEFVLPSVGDSLTSSTIVAHPTLLLRSRSG
jgi:hypothetical protein